MKKSYIIAAVSMGTVMLVGGVAGVYFLMKGNKGSCRAILKYRDRNIKYRWNRRWNPCFGGGRST
jgi:hypothetical protein